MVGQLQIYYMIRLILGGYVFVCISIYAEIKTDPSARLEHITYFCVVESFGQMVHGSECLVSLG